MVPTALARQFDKADASLDKPPGEQALPGVVSGVFIGMLEAVEFFCGFGFAGDVA